MAQPFVVGYEMLALRRERKGGFQGTLPLLYMSSLTSALSHEMSAESFCFPHAHITLLWLCAQGKSTRGHGGQARMFIREVTPVSPLSLLLFGGTLLVRDWILLPPIRPNPCRLHKRASGQ